MAGITTRTCLWICALLAGILPSNADTKYGPTWGAGRASCGVWLDAREAKEKNTRLAAAALAEWFSGYISAHYANETVKELSDLEVDKIVNGWLNTYCTSHRNALIADAAKAFVASRKSFP